MLFNENNLKCARFASKDDTRAELAGVFFTDSKTVATDTYSLLEVTTPNDVKPEDFPEVNGKTAMRGCKPFIVPAKALKEIKIPKSKTLPVLENMAIGHVADDRVEFMTTDLEQGKNTVIKRIESRYPDYEQIIPSGSPTIELKIDGNYLANMAKAMAEVATSNGSLPIVTVKIYGDGKNKPIVFTSRSDRQQARGVVMPVKS